MTFHLIGSTTKLGSVENMSYGCMQAVLQLTALLETCSTPTTRPIGHPGAAFYYGQGPLLPKITRFVREKHYVCVVRLSVDYKFARNPRR